MSSTLWSNYDLRRYLMADRGFYADTSVLESQHDDFRAAARVQLAPIVQRRLLETAGVTTDPDGIAYLAFELLENHGHWSSKRNWMIMCDDPWAYLTDWVAKRARKAYTSSVKVTAPNDRALAGIAAASTRLGITE